MDITAITGIITNLGFPIACVVFLSFFIYKVLNDNKKDSTNREEKMNKTIEVTNELNKELSATNMKICETNEKLVQHMTKDLSVVKNDVNDIKNILLK